MSDQNITNEYVTNLLNDLKSVYSGRSLEDIAKIIRGLALSPKLTEELEARKLAADMGYVYHNGEKGRPSNWDREYVLKRNGIEDGVKATADGWRWAERSVNTNHDIIGIHTDPPQPSNEMTLQGLWFWHKHTRLYVQLSSVINGVTEWEVTANGIMTFHLGTLHEVLAKLRDTFIECEHDIFRVSEKLLEIQDK